MNALLLRLVWLLAPLWEKLGVDVGQLKIILSTKLKMDNRTPMASFNKQKPRKPTRWATIIQFVVLMVMGSFFLLFFFLVKNSFVSLSVYFLAVMCVLGLTLVADFSTILLDTRDQYILLPRPVNDRTVAIARIMHMGIRLLGQLVGIGLPALVYMLLFRGLGAAGIFLLQMIITGMLSLLLVNLFYLFFLRFLPIQKFKDVISYLQIVFSVLIFAGYYVGPRLIQSEYVQEIRIEQIAWTWLLPPVWIAALQQLLSAPTVLAIVLSSLALLSPIVALWFAAKVFSSGFNAKIAALSTGGARQGEGKKSIGKEEKIPFYSKLSVWFTSSPLERAGFNIIWLVTARTREFKQQLYPTLAYIPVYFFVLFFMGRGSSRSTFAEKLQEIEAGGTYIVMFYLAIFSLITVLQLVTKSERYKAAWIYYAAPLQEPGHLMSGVLKACFIKFFLPFSLLFLAISLPLFGVKIINDVLLSIAIGGIEAVLISLFLVKSYPFSRPTSKVESKMLVNLMVMSVVGILGFCHYAIAKYELAVWVATLLFWGIFLLMLRYFKKDKWESLGYDEG